MHAFAAAFDITGNCRSISRETISHGSHLGKLRWGCQSGGTHLNAGTALQIFPSISCKLAGSRLIVTRAGGWRTALVAFRRSPCPIVEIAGDRPLTHGSFSARHAFWSSLQAFWAAYERMLCMAPIRTQAFAMAVIW